MTPQGSLTNLAQTSNSWPVGVWAITICIKWRIWGSKFAYQVAEDRIFHLAEVRKPKLCTNEVTVKETSVLATKFCLSKVFLILLMCLLVR